MKKAESEQTVRQTRQGTIMSGTATKKWDNDNSSSSSSSVRLRAPRKHKTATAAVTMISSIEPREVDILCGKSKECVTHPGNSRYRQFIDAFQPKYAKCTNKQSKMDVTKEIVTTLSRTSRFLRYNTEAQCYEELSHLEARDKTSHALRTACKRVSKQQKKRATKQITNISTSPIRSMASPPQHYSPQYHQSSSLARPPVVARSSSINDPQYQPLSLHEDRFDDNTCFGDLLSLLKEPVLDGGSE
ncbi:expressed unknown protein [Seminavis robusta]|uniref:DUF6824 domain-containing protein n=1 Tax=Seminavis robusta TaxID=568900 RepID=A0A9N8H2Q6_9STRA|nr:expressed unknown protein [Seminavis robusta]|eukprot:Sro23_g015660.1 n/a (245) ;mRNA; f:42803-43537